MCFDLQINGLTGAKMSVWSHILSKNYYKIYSQRVHIKQFHIHTCSQLCEEDVCTPGKRTDP